MYGERKWPVRLNRENVLSAADARGHRHETEGAGIGAMTGAMLGSFGGLVGALLGGGLGAVLGFILGGKHHFSNPG